MLNWLLVDDGGGLGDIRSIFNRLGEKRQFTSVDLASGFVQQEIAEEENHKAASRTSDGLLWEANRAAFGLKCSSFAFANRVSLTVRDLNSRGVEGWLVESLMPRARSINTQP